MTQCGHPRPPAAGRDGLNTPLDSGLRRNDEMAVEASVVVAACPWRAVMMIKIKVAAMCSIAPSSFRRRPESSGFNNPFPRERG